jgi:20S proteasome alpha/beta subunit
MMGHNSTCFPSGHGKPQKEPIRKRVIQRKKRDLTYILGGYCADGICLVGDTRISVDSGTDYTYSKKILLPYAGLVLGASGSVGYFNSFQTRLLRSLEDLRRDNDAGRIPDDFDMGLEFRLITEKVIHEMGREYGARDIANELDVLVAYRLAPKPTLLYFNGTGTHEYVVGYKVIGHGEPYGSIFLKLRYSPALTMSQFAKLGCMIVRYIQDSRLDYSVGLNPDTHDQPQVIVIPNVPDGFDGVQANEQFPIRELQRSEVRDLTSGWEENIRKIQETINTLNL